MASLSLIQALKERVTHMGQMNLLTNSRAGLFTKGLHVVEVLTKGSVFVGNLSDCYCIWRGSNGQMNYDFKTQESAPQIKLSGSLQ